MLMFTRYKWSMNRDSFAVASSVANWPCVYQTQCEQIRGGKSHFDTMKGTIPIHELACSCVQFNISKCSPISTSESFSGSAPLIHLCPHSFSIAMVWTAKPYLTSCLTSDLMCLHFNSQHAMMCGFFFHTQKPNIYLTQLCSLWALRLTLFAFCQTKLKCLIRWWMKRCWLFPMRHCCGFRHIPFSVRQRKSHQTGWWHSIFNILIWLGRYSEITPLLIFCTAF